MWYNTHLSLTGVDISGVHLFEKVCVERVEVENGRVCGVKTNKGDIKCEVFVNCGGQVCLCSNNNCSFLLFTVVIFMQWARELGQLCDPLVNIPLQPTEHYNIVTKPMEGTLVMILENVMSL